MRLAEHSEREAGFTLFELLIALMLSALILAVIAPSLESAVPGQQLSAAVRELAADLRYERVVAMRDERQAAVTLEPTRRRYTVTAEPRVRMFFEGIIAEPTTIALRERGRASVAIRFYPDGSSSGGRVALRDGRHSMFVAVDWLTGRVTIE